MTEFLGKPITPERVKEAYDLTGFLPLFGDFAKNIAGDECGCALTAMAAVDGGYPTAGAAYLESVSPNLNRDLWAFLSGFDNNGNKMYLDTIQYGLGLACRAVVT